MKRRQIWFGAAFAVLAVLAASMYFSQPCAVEAGTDAVASCPYDVLAPISQGNLTIFPVVARTSFDTRGFLTLDEGLRSGEVIISEANQAAPLIRRRHSNVRPPNYGWGETNRLILINNSERPLLLLAGEVVTGGHQDRIVGADRIIPGESDADLSVFCIEHGRSTGASVNFVASGAYGKTDAYMAQPSVRAQANNKDQRGVWDEVAKTKVAMAAPAAEAIMVQDGTGGVAGGPLDNSPRPAPVLSPSAANELASTTSYARVMETKEVSQAVDKVAMPIQHSYESLMRELRNRNAVGVVVAVNGRIIWADIFASNELLTKYWPKLVRSYAAEAIETYARYSQPSVQSAQQFLNQLDGRKEVVESEPGIFRHAEIIGDGYKVFELTSLLPRTGFQVHLSKMAD